MSPETRLRPSRCGAVALSRAVVVVTIGFANLIRSSALVMASDPAPARLAETSESAAPAEIDPAEAAIDAPEKRREADASGWFPAKQPFLMPYLEKRDVPSKFCLQPGSVFPDPVI